MLLLLLSISRQGHPSVLSEQWRTAPIAVSRLWQDKDVLNVSSTHTRTVFILSTCAIGIETTGCDKIVST